MKKDELDLEEQAELYAKHMCAIRELLDIKNPKIHTAVIIETEALLRANREVNNAKSLEKHIKKRTKDLVKMFRECYGR